MTASPSTHSFTTNGQSLLFLCQVRLQKESEQKKKIEKESDQKKESDKEIDRKFKRKREIDREK